ncbi:MAG: hypothetical protein RIS79_267 [Verrucomicrobiota bacterium]|jgi:hypothetical protein
MKSETPIRWWQMLIGFAVMIVLILLWGIGFDWLARELQGGLIESVLNWLSNAAFWCVILAVILAFIIRGVVSEKSFRPHAVQSRRRSLIEFPEAFHAFRYQVRDSQDNLLGELSLAEVQRRLDNGTLTDNAMVYHPDKQEWLSLDVLRVYIHHQQQDFRLHHQTFAVNEDGVLRGEFTLDEICLALNRGNLSRNILIQDDQDGWLTIEQMGIDFKPSASQPAPPWAG